jgi:hypothetical protein
VSNSSTSLDRYRDLARLYDDAFRVPILGIRIGIDALIGLIPGVGDMAGGILGGYGLVVGYRLGAPFPVMLRMLLNIAIDVLIGSVPLLGDIFDAVWKSNTKNRRLLERWLERPHATRRGSALLLATIGSGFLLLLGVAAWLAWTLLLLLLHKLSG